MAQIKTSHQCKTILSKWFVYNFFPQPTEDDGAIKLFCRILYGMWSHILVEYGWDEEDFESTYLGQR